MGPISMRIPIFAVIVLLICMTVYGKSDDQIPSHTKIGASSTIPLFSGDGKLHDYDDVGQQNALFQGDALEFQRQQVGLGARTFDFDPMATNYRSPNNFDKITDTSLFFDVMGNNPNHRNGMLKEYNADTGLYELRMPFSDSM